MDVVALAAFGRCERGADQAITNGIDSHVQVGQQRGDEAATLAPGLMARKINNCLGKGTCRRRDPR